MRGWDKHLPGRLLGAWPTRQWVRRLQRRGQAGLGRLWRQVEAKSPAPRRRWPWTWVGADRLCRPYGPPLGLVGLGWSGQEPRGRLGIDGRRLLVVRGEGKRVVPVDFTGRRPDPLGLGRPCRDTLTWRQVRLARTWLARRRRCRPLPAPLVTAESWWGDSGWRAPVANGQHGTVVGEGQTSYVCQRPDGRRVKGRDLLTRDDWAWHARAQLPGRREVRLAASRPTDGPVTRVIGDTPGPDRCYGRCQATRLSAPRLMRAWRRRRWIAPRCRTVKPWLATEACQVPGDEASSGPRVLRLLAGLVLL